VAGRLWPILAQPDESVFSLACRANNHKIEGLGDRAPNFAATLALVFGLAMNHYG